MHMVYVLIIYRLLNVWDWGAPGICVNDVPVLG